MGSGILEGRKPMVLGHSEIDMEYQVEVLADHKKAKSQIVISLLILIFQVNLQNLSH
jgi:hypothetical protein